MRKLIQFLARISMVLIAVVVMGAVNTATGAGALVVANTPFMIKGFTEDQSKGFAEFMKDQSEDIQSKVKDLLKDAAKSGDLTELKELLNGEGEKKGLVGNFKAMQEQLDQVSTDLKKGNFGGGGSYSNEDFETEVKGQWEKLKKGAKTIDLSEKAAATILRSTHLLGDRPIQYDRQPGILAPVTRKPRVRDLVMPGQTSSSDISYMEETTYTDGTAITAEGAAAGLSDFKLTEKTAKVHKITAQTKISEETMDDFPAFLSYINGRLRRLYELKEEDKLMKGTGINEQTGIITAAGEYTQTALKVNSPNYIDAIIAAMTQMAVGEYEANAVWVNPIDHAKILLEKDSNGAYVANKIIQVSSTGQVTILGRPIITSTAITAGNVLVGDFNSSQVFDRKGVSIEMADQNSDDFEKGLKTIKISGRLAFVNYRPSAYVYDSFTDIITAITPV